MSMLFTAGQKVQSYELNYAGKTYEDDIGAANAYSIDPQIDDGTGSVGSPSLTDAYTSLTEGQFFAFRAANASTGASTLQVNAISAVSIKKNIDQDLDAGDIKAGDIILVAYDGTNMQLISKSSQVNTIFGGDGSDGDLTISSGTTNIDVGGANVYVLNYKSISITGTGKLTFSNPASDGTIVIIKCQRDAVITSTATPAIDLTGMGAAGGAINGGDGTNAFAIMDELDHFGGGGVQNGDSVGGNQISDQKTYTIDAKFLPRGIFVTPGSGGGGGKVDSSSTGGQDASGGAGAGSLYGAGANGLEGLAGSNGASNSVGASGGGAAAGFAGIVQTAGVGGNGGGALVLQVQGDLNLTGDIWAKGQDGEDGAGTGTGQVTGGGGGAGGMIVVLHGNNLIASSGALDTSGGNGGDSSGGDLGGTGGASAGGIVAKYQFI